VKKRSHILYYLVLSVSALPHLSMALPLDWNGSFGVNTTVIDTYRKTDAHDNTVAGSGGQAIPEPAGNPDNAKFQSYIFSLSPSIVVNDSASIFSDFTTGYGKGGFLGDATGNKNNFQGANFANALYHFNTANDNNLEIRKLYAELYSDTATYVLGRMPLHWGLGAVFNEGKNVWDRHTSLEDGIMAKFVIGNFHISPYWTKLNSVGSISSESDVTSFGAQLLYDNSERDLTFGIMLSKRKASAQNATLTTRTDGASQSILGATKVNLVDIYLQKGWGRFNFTIEVPIIDGDLGNVYGVGDTSYKTNAIITESSYNLNSKWDLSLNFGHIKGHNGTTGKFRAMYLHPNYQIATLLFRYNLQAVSDSTVSIYDSYMTNANYIQFGADYKTNKWVWSASALWAQAIEVAKNGKNFFNHETNILTNAAVKSQQDKYGLEIDLAFDYKWNTNVTIEGDVGYLLVGDYYKFTNTETDQNLHNSFVALLQAAVHF